MSRFRPHDYRAPLPDNYLAKGWFEPGSGARRTLRPELLEEWAFRKAYDLLERGVGPDAVRAVDHHLRRLAFGAERAPDGELPADERDAIITSVRDLASVNRSLDAWLTAAFKSVHQRNELMALSAHVQAVHEKVLELDALRRADPNAP